MKNISNELIKNVNISDELENKDLAILYSDTNNKISNNTVSNKNSNTDINNETKIEINNDSDYDVIGNLINVIDDIYNNISDNEFIIKSMLKTIYSLINQYKQYTDYIKEANLLLRELVDEQAIVKQSSNIIQLLSERKKILSDIFEAISNIQKHLNEKQRIEIQKIKVNQVDDDIINNILTR